MIWDHRLNFFPIIHVWISYNSEILKDWEGLPVEKETKIKDYFENKSVLYLTCGMQILK